MVKEKLGLLENKNTETSGIILEINQRKPELVSINF
jgi:hypothetical protein